jgi:hypothetical protein
MVMNAIGPRTHEELVDVLSPVDGYDGHRPAPLVEQMVVGALAEQRGYRFA